MSGRAFSRSDRAKACWHGHDSPRTVVTAARREEMQRLALEDGPKFVRCLRLARVVSLSQLPWWPEFAETNPWEAAKLILMACELGIGRG